MRIGGKERALRIVAFFAAVFIHVAIYLFFNGPGMNLMSQLFPEVSEKPARIEPQKQLLDMVFVEVPSTAQSPPDEETPYYSNQDSQAHTEDPTKEDTNLAPQEGEQEDILRLEDVTLEESVTSQLQPDESESEDSNQSEQAEPLEDDNSDNLENGEGSSAAISVRPPTLPDNKGTPPALTADEKESEFPAIDKINVNQDINTDAPDRKKALIEPPEAAKPAPPSSRPRKKRPRNLREAKKAKNLVGEKTRILSQSDKNPGATGMVDASNKSFGDYDLRLQVSIQNTWYKYISNLIAGSVDRGVVKIKFRLHESGSIEETKVLETAVGSLFTASCQDAIENAAPFGKWTKKMRNEIGKPYRDIIFTFIYR